MFRISKKTEYGILALQYILSRQENQSATVREISEKHRISQTLLAKILQKLVKANIIRSVQGSRGGYIMGGDAKSISLKDIFEAIEGPIHLTECDFDDKCCDRYNGCSLKDSFVPIHQQITGYFENISLADLAANRVTQ
jgi:Rrf2 family transcriptional regulator, cysteine metabolism repressor